MLCQRRIVAPGNKEMTAVIRLDKHAQPISFAADGDEARTRSDAAFQAERDRSGSGANRPFLDRPRCRAVDRQQNFIDARARRANIVEA